MPSDKETLLSMGFDSGRVEWALRATNNAGLQPAMDHILEHEGQPVPDLAASGSVAASSGNASAGPSPMDEDDEDAEELRLLMGKGTANVAAAGTEVEAKSIKCSQCGKIFKNTALANFHAEKSGHDQFEESTEEIKPLTEEEKAQKLQELREKMAAKRSKKAEEEAAAVRENEKIRRKQGKDLGKLKEEMKEREAIKEAEKKRKEKLEDARARAAIKAQIEADKKARAEKAAQEKALREGQPLPAATPAPTAPKPQAATSGVAGRDFKETRLQIRMASGGQPYTTTLSSDATLREVAEFLAGQTLSVDVETVQFAQHFPRKSFIREDFSRTLRDLGLTPSAVLIAS